jgi:hypothetical protein
MTHRGLLDENGLTRWIGIMMEMELLDGAL